MTQVSRYDYNDSMANDLNRQDVALPPVDGRILIPGGSGRFVVVTTPLDILQVQESVLELGGAFGLGSRDVNAAVAAVSRLASALLTYSGEAAMRFSPAKGGAGLEVEGRGGLVACDADRRRIEAGIVRLLGHDDWTVPSDGGSRVSARKTFRKNEEKRVCTNQQYF